MLRKQNRMAAFMLHQATEQLLLAMFKMATGLHINTHNIDKLIRYCAMVNYKVPAIFAKGNETSERLLRLLQDAYIGSRYKEDFTVSTADINELTVKLETFLKLFKESHHK